MRVIQIHWYFFHRLCVRGFPDDDDEDASCLPANALLGWLAACDGFVGDGAVVSANASKRGAADPSTGPATMTTITMATTDTTMARNSTMMSPARARLPNFGRPVHTITRNLIMGSTGRDVGRYCRRYESRH